MDFALNDDHLALREAVHRFCEGEFPFETRGNSKDAAKRAQLWQGMAELGLLGLTCSADVGGSELSAVEVMLASQELGRALGNNEFHAQAVLTGTLLTRLANAAQQAEWLAPVVAGEQQVAFALYEPGKRYAWDQPSTTATPVAGGWVLQGSKSLVLCGADAHRLFVLASVPSEGQNALGVFAVEPQQAGVRLQAYGTLDGGHAASVLLNQVQVPTEALVGTLSATREAVEYAVDAATAALVAEAAGAAEVLLEQTADYLRTRKQFGATLSKFQVLQHRLADMATTTEQFKSMACAAAAAMTGDDTRQRRRVVSGAKLFVSQQARKLGLDAIQMYGGMGMTDECRIGHYAKRLMTIVQMHGDVSYHAQRLSSVSAFAG